ncbi:hypothetical protein [Gallaecimonas xiamenensis]|uniref:Uncharacterized protein n=1 Tax=Gallaecimonas xiamenensis 3-C-1 TaxID=745411 RepID=K2K3H4_9GAMM|nr:hypothetical protein [Gallaecimonas xiamenensis]EKE77509.1 hypothetical protein B3C1_01820 [Gallaecimonas xiamenensis 3-C-1]
MTTFKRVTAKVLAVLLILLLALAWLLAAVLVSNSQALTRFQEGLLFSGLLVMPLCLVLVLLGFFKGRRPGANWRYGLPLAAVLCYGGQLWWLWP